MALLAVFSKGQAGQNGTGGSRQSNSRVAPAQLDGCKKKSVLPDLRMLVARVALRERSGDIVAPRYQLTNPELFPRKARAMVQGRGDATN